MSIDKPLTREEVPQKTKEQWFDEGNAHRNAGRYQEAIAAYNCAIALDLNSALAYNNRGAAYYALKKHQKAIADYDRAIALDPKLAQAYNNRGTAYYALKKHQKAIAAYDRAIALDPNFALAYNNRGAAYYALKKHQKAIADYDRAIALDPKLAQAYNNRGTAYRALNPIRKATIGPAQFFKGLAYVMYFVMTVLIILFFFFGIFFGRDPLSALGINSGMLLIIAFALCLIAYWAAEAATTNTGAESINRRYFIYSLVCIGCVGLSVWLGFFSPLAYYNYVPTQLPPGTYCIGACGGAPNSNPSGAGLGIVPMGIFLLIAIGAMLGGIVARNVGSLKAGIAISLVTVILYAFFFWQHVL